MTTATARRASLPKRLLALLIAFAAAVALSIDLAPVAAYADATASITTFEMPANDVTVTATYEYMDTVAMPVFNPSGGATRSCRA